jgi:outer membrane protein, heavy metal efflux system
MSPRSVVLGLLAVAIWSTSWVGVARAQQQVVPASTELPQTLSLDEALHIFKSHGLELLISEANVRSAEGAVKIAGAVPNPVASTSVGNALTYSNTKYSSSNCLANGAECTPWIYNVGITDSAALEDTISGKRGLRQKVARNALAAAKLSRVDAERTISFQVESAYFQVAQAALGYKFAKDVADSNVTILEKVRIWLAQGKSGITDADIARMETQKSESDQALDTAQEALRQARVALAFLMGVRGEVPDFDVDTHVLNYRLPGLLRDATEVGLLRTAFAHRPDLHAAGYNVYSAEAALSLVRRQRFPDITTGVNFAWGGFRRPVDQRSCRPTSHHLLAVGADSGLLRARGRAEAGRGHARHQLAATCDDDEAGRQRRGQRLCRLRRDEETRQSYGEG